MSGGVTANYGLVKPNFNIKPWDGPVNANWDLIDTILYTIAQVPNIAGTWRNSTAYTVGQNVLDPVSLVFYQCLVANTSAATGTFAADRAANPANWTLTNPGQGSLRYDMGQVLLDSQLAQVLTNAGLYVSPLFVTADTALTVGQFDKAVRVSGTAKITAPTAGAGWRSGVIVNTNTVSGLVTLAVPTGATLDGTLNGTTILFPYQKARILQLDATTYITDWVDRSPIIRQVTASAVASIDLPLPVGYNTFRVMASSIVAATSGAIFGARLSDDNGATIKVGASDYTVEAILADGNTAISNAIVTGSYLQLSGTIYTANAANRLQTELTLDPGGGGFYPNIRALTGTVDNAVSLRSTRIYSGACLSIAANRANLLRLLMSSGTFSGAVTLVGVP